MGSIVGFETFLRILARRLNGKYSTDTLKKVISAYTSHSSSMQGEIDRHNEFRDDYFGSFRYSDKGWDSLKEFVAERMEEKLRMSRISHELQRWKKEAEKKNKLVWKTMNQIEGYKFKDSKKKDQFKKKSKSKASQISFLNSKLRRKLKTERKLRRL